MRLIFTFLLLFPTLLFAQFQFYYPSGKKIDFKARTIKDVLDTLHIEEYDNYNTKNGVVFFKKFTQTPLFIVWFVKPQTNQTRQLIASYSSKYNEYLRSYEYYSDLKRLSKENTLTEEFIQQTFGKPTFISKKEDTDSTKVFFNFNCVLGYKYGIVKEIDVINYRDALNKHKLLINEFTVTGNDYSIGFDIELTNFDKKPIKYTYITVTATNPVDDIVGKKTFTAVGPIESREKGAYSFDNGIMSRAAKYLVIDQIKLVYFDGTQRLLTRQMVKSILHTDWTKFD